MLAGAPWPPSPGTDWTPTRASCLLPRARSRSSGRGSCNSATVTVQTDAAGLLHLAVDVRRESDGTLRSAAARRSSDHPRGCRSTSIPDERLGDIDDAELRATMARALHNYLAGDANQLRD